MWLDPIKNELAEDVGFAFIHVDGQIDDVARFIDLRLGDGSKIDMPLGLVKVLQPLETVGHAGGVEQAPCLNGRLASELVRRKQGCVLEFDHTETVLSPWLDLDGDVC